MNNEQMIDDLRVITVLRRMLTEHLDKFADDYGIQFCGYADSLHVFCGIYSIADAIGKTPDIYDREDSFAPNRAAIKFDKVELFQLSEMEGQFLGAVERPEPEEEEA